MAGRSKGGFDDRSGLGTEAGILGGILGVGRRAGLVRRGGVLTVCGANMLGGNTLGLGAEWGSMVGAELAAIIECGKTRGEITL